MRIVLQRVKNASVDVSGRRICAIGPGFLLLVAIGHKDDAFIAREMARKISKLRIFEDREGKMNLDLKSYGGEILSVPQFTLYANTQRGNRPGFEEAAEPAAAKAIWKVFNEELEGIGVKVETGEFAAHMEVESVNDGPVTFILEI